MQVKLKVITGSHEGREIAISSEKFLIGRSDVCQLRPKSESVSRKHCILVLREGRVLIQDLKSRNGTYINDKRLPADKAKVLKAGDRLRIGKLEFDVLIEHGLQAAKKPEVTDMGDAAARTVEAGASDSKFEEVDVTSWLDEADQIDRVKKISDPETRQFRLDEAKSSDEDRPESGEISVGDASGAGENDDSDDSIASVDQGESKAKLLKRKKQPPGKLPTNLKKALTDNSRDAADDALRRFFSGQ